MPRTSRPRRYRRKPAYRRKRMMKSRTRLLGSTVYSFKRRVVLGNISASCNGAGVGTPAAYGRSFALSDLVNYTEFTALFDQYKITGVKLDFIPFADNVSWEVASLANLTATPGGPLLIAPDHDDATPPADANEMLQRQDTKVLPVGRRHRMFIKPKYNVATYSGGGVRPASGWLDAGSVGVPHYGVKAWMAAPNVPNSNFTYQVWATYYIKCKGVQ